MSSPKLVNKNIPWRLNASDRRTLLIIGDVIAVVAAILVALYVWSQRDWLHFSWQFLTVRVPFWFYLLPLLWLFAMVELYDIHRANRLSFTLRGLAKAAFICLALYLFIYFTSEPNSLPRRGVAAFIASVTVITLIWRIIYIQIFNQPDFMRRVLIIGAGRAGKSLIEMISSVWPPPFYVVGIVDDDPEKANTLLGNFRVMGNAGNMLEIIHQEMISDLIVAITGEIKGSMFQAILDAQEQGIQITTMPVVYEELLGRVPIFHLDADWMVRSFSTEVRATGFYELTKRIIDILGGLIGVIGILIMLPFITLAIYLDSGKPIFYSQNRLGKGGARYRIWKFRTMYADAEKDGKIRTTTENDTRITRVGRFLRRSHLDELPQFYSVLRGEMSLVGPRAEREELVKELQTHIPFYRARLLVKPGLTGWAQVNYRYAATIEETATKLEYDLYYIKHRNLLLDMVILLRTVGVVVGLKGQ